MTTSVGEDFPRMQAQVRQLQKYGEEIGPSGAFYVAVCRKALEDADAALASGDVVKIVAGALIAPPSPEPSPIDEEDMLLGALCVWLDARRR